MVTISDYKVRQNIDGKSFCTLILTGGIELVKSNSTGQFYATVRKASITSTFTEDVCKTLIGKPLPGIIEKQECDAYEHVVAETGETVTLNHRYVFNPKPNSVSMEEAVMTPEMEVSVAAE